MDILLVREERNRVADQFRAKLSAMAALRIQLAEAASDEARQHLHQAVDKEADLCRKLGAKLLALDGLII
jgi:hypothetical protein